MRIACSHWAVSTSSVRSSRAATKRRRSSSMLAWFCDVGGTIRALVGQRLHLDDHRLTHECEQAIRNYDPCISCATHFLTLSVERSHR